MNLKKNGSKEYFLITLIFIFWPLIAFTEENGAMGLLKAIDANLWSKTKFIHGRLIIDNGRRVRSLALDTWMEGIDKSYSLYKSPPREKGTQMLKIFHKLWMYTPRTDRKLLVAGHLLTCF